MVVSPHTMESLHEGRSSLKWIRDIKFSSDGAMLALASEDGSACPSPPSNVRNSNS